MLSADYVNTSLFGIYPYVCLAVLLLGSLIRFDREPYTWKSDSSQMLRKRATAPRLEPVPLRRARRDLRPFRRASWRRTGRSTGRSTRQQHQLLAMVVGGIAGLDRDHRPDAS